MLSQNIMEKEKPLKLKYNNRNIIYKE
jgi:hypothetical protein